ncbi:glycosyltransferase [Desulfonatronospira sp.]|uniref:glycosyltransferase n=1 Tax=Desulfonatronospira sp. TaxID=1962951 RepID=UPI0025C388F7|nr:glycosyltransferase [Desulfonatronospira sp.]
MQKTKVMFVVIQLEAGGSERVVLELARGLNRDQFEIYVTAFNGGVLEAPLREVCKEIFFIQKRRRFDFSAMIHLAKIVREHRIDIVNAHHYMPCFYSFFGTKILNRKKLIYTEHSVPEVEGIASGKHGKILNMMLFRINAVVGVSGEITERFKDLYPRHSDKFYEILNGVDIEKFKQGEARNDIRRHWGFCNDHFVIGMVANFKKVKNHACLVRAAGRLKDVHPQLRLLFVGTGFPGDPDSMEEKVRELIRQLGLQDRAILAGYQENIPEMLSAFDLFCLPSFSEGLPVSVLEAMAAGAPVVGSHVRGIKEVVKNRETGLLFTSNNDSELALALEEILSNPSFGQYLANQAANYVQKIHSQKVWAQKTADLFLSD